MSQAQYDQLTDDQHQAFLDLATARSPENLSGDGEHSPAMQRRMYQDLQRQWQALETQAGLRVTETEVWTREHRAELAARHRRRPH